MLDLSKQKKIFFLVFVFVSLQLMYYNSDLLQDQKLRAVAKAQDLFFFFLQFFSSSIYDSIIIVQFRYLVCRRRSFCWLLPVISANNLGRKSLWLISPIFSHSFVLFFVCSFFCFFFFRNNVQEFFLQEIITAAENSQFWHLTLLKEQSFLLLFSLFFLC